MKNIITLSLIVYSLFAQLTRSNNVVYDDNTNLYWQDDISAKNHANSWSGAINDCNTLTLDNKDDWRLPNINELYSIIDHTLYNPPIYSTFVNSSNTSYWSSTTSYNSSTQAYSIRFYYGSIELKSKSLNHTLRCVRGGKDYIEHDSGIIFYDK